MRDENGPTSSIRHVVRQLGSGIRRARSTHNLANVAVDTKLFSVKNVSADVPADGDCGNDSAPYSENCGQRVQGGQPNPRITPSKLNV